MTPRPLIKPPRPPTRTTPRTSPRPKSTRSPWTSRSRTRTRARTTRGDYAARDLAQAREGAWQEPDQLTGMAHDGAGQHRAAACEPCHGIRDINQNAWKWTDKLDNSVDWDVLFMQEIAGDDGDQEWGEDGEHSCRRGLVRHWHSRQQARPTEGHHREQQERRDPQHGGGHATTQPLASHLQSLAHLLAAAGRVQRRPPRTLCQQTWSWRTSFGSSGRKLARTHRCRKR